MNNKYNNVLNDLVKFLNKVPTTGINEANNLIGCAMFVEQLARGDLIITESERPKTDRKID